MSSLSLFFFFWPVLIFSFPSTLSDRGFMTSDSSYRSLKNRENYRQVTQRLKRLAPGVNKHPNVCM